MPAELRDRVPTVGAWSVTMVLEHLAQTEASVASLVDRLAADAPARPKGEAFTPAEFAAHVDMPFFVDRSRRIKGRQPTGAMSEATAWNALNASRRALIAAMERGAGLKLEERSHDHPAGRTLDGYRWIAFVGLHEARHAAQVREIAERLVS